MAVRPDGFGPLPEVDRNDELQRLSFSRLSSVVPTDLFILRDEAGSDKGVDKTLEAIVSGGATNLRAQIQMKGSDSKKFNADGSLSRQIETSNFNYLLNGTSGIYILWIECRDELRFVWARDEALRLYQENPDWQNQGTVTLRFCAVLDAQAWDTVHTRILAEGRLHREVHDVLTRTTSTEPVKVAISESCQVTTPDHAEKLLRGHGINLVSAGYGQAVQQQATLLSIEQLSQPLIQLVLGYAAFSLGDYLAARSYLGRVATVRHQLSVYDQYIFDSLFCTCDYYLGRIPREEYQKRGMEAEKRAPAFLAKQLRWDRLRKEHITAQDREIRTQALSELETLADELETDPAVSENAKLQVALSRLYAKMAQSNSAWLTAISTPNAVSSMGLPGWTTSTVEDIRTAHSTAELLQREANQLQERAVQLGHPSLIAEAIIVKDLPLILRYSNLLLVSRMSGNTPPQIPDDAYTTIARDLQSAIDLFQLINNTEGIVRVQLVLAQWCDITDHMPEAVSYAKTALETAKAMAYDRQIKDAEEIISGRSQYRQLLHEILNPPDFEVRITSQTDDSVKVHAREMLRLMAIPEERLPVLERSLLALRRFATEKLQWCQRFQVLLPTA